MSVAGLRWGSAGVPAPVPPLQSGALPSGPAGRSGSLGQYGGCDPLARLQGRVSGGKEVTASRQGGEMAAELLFSWPRGTRGGVKALAGVPRAEVRMILSPLSAPFNTLLNLKKKFTCFY